MIRVCVGATAAVLVLSLGSAIAFADDSGSNLLTTAPTQVDASFEFDLPTFAPAGTEIGPSLGGQRNSDVTSFSAWTGQLRALPSGESLAWSLGATGALSYRPTESGSEWSRWIGSSSDTGTNWGLLSSPTATGAGLSRSATDFVMPVRAIYATPILAR